MEEQLIYREEVTALLFNVSDMAHSLARIEATLLGGGEEDDEEEADES